MSWIYPTVLLCLYGFFKEMKPSEPFLTPYLREPPKNFTDEQLDNEVYPFWTYSYFAALFVIFFITDFLCYKPVIITEALAYLGTRILLIWGTSILAMRLMQVTYGIATAGEIAYYSYIFAAVSPEHYQKVNSYTRAAILVGRMMSGVLGQLFVSLHVTNYLGLNYISFGSIVVSLLFALVLPRVSSTARAFIPRNQSETDTISKLKEFAKAWKTYFIDFLHAFKLCYSKNLLVRWSIWSALATCGEYLVENYVQNIWDEIRSPHHHRIYNGGVTAVSHFFAAIVAYLLSFPRINWTVWGELCLAIFSVVDCFVLFIIAGTKNVWVSYCCYVLFRIIYTFLITIATLQIARLTALNHYGLVLGCNMFVSLALQTILTSAVVDKHGLGLNAKKQFVFYAFFFYIIGAIFLAMAVYTMTSLGWQTCWRLRYLPRDVENTENNSEPDESSSETTTHGSQLSVADHLDPSPGNVQDSTSKMI